MWSLRNTSTGASEQSVLNRLRAPPAAWLSTSWLRDRVSHLGLPSFMPLMACLTTVAREMVDCTPSVFSRRHISSSMVASAPWVAQASRGVLTITTSTSELVE
ncbi:hypothetical protein FQZ97_1006840 [compost metagenome]